MALQALVDRHAYISCYPPFVAQRFGEYPSGTNTLSEGIARHQKLHGTNKTLFLHVPESDRPDYKDATRIYVLAAGAYIHMVCQDEFVPRPYAGDIPPN